MFARFSVLLPFEFSVVLDSPLQPQRFDLPTYGVRIHAPCRSDLNPLALSPETTPIIEIARSLIPAATQTPSDITFDGKPTTQANLLRVDFLKASFDRRRSVTAGVPPKESLALGDPPITLAFDVLNQWLRRYKHRFRAPNVRLIRPSETFWVLQYLDDDEKELPSDPLLIKLRTGFHRRLEIAAIDSSIWDRVGEIPLEWEPWAWEVLLLDAPALLPEIGPAVVLAYASLEAFIDWALDNLAAATTVPAPLWSWINTRDNNFWLWPRTTEQFDVLLKSLTGKSLKDDAKLWELFRNLATARHSYVHTGKAVIGQDEVTLDRAAELVAGAASIVDWVEGLLPAAVRRPPAETGHTIQVAKKIAVGVPSPQNPASDANQSQ